MIVKKKVFSHFKPGPLLSIWICATYCIWTNPLPRKNCPLHQRVNTFLFWCI